MDENANKEIENALKEFEQKTEIEEKKNPTYVPTASFNEKPKIVELVMKASGGSITDQRRAEYVILVIVAVMVLASLYLFLNDGEIKKTAPPGATMNLNTIRP